MLFRVSRMRPAAAAKAPAASTRTQAVGHGGLTSDDIIELHYSKKAKKAQTAMQWLVSRTEPGDCQNKRTAIGTQRPGPRKSPTQEPWTAHWQQLLSPESPQNGRQPKLVSSFSGTFF